MTKKNQKAHLIKVSQSDGYSDTIICVSHDIDEAAKFRGFEYFKLLTAIDSPGLSIPYDRQATFKEELRVLDRAAYTDQNGAELEARIRDLVTKAYDPGVTITITQIQ